MGIDNPNSTQERLDPARARLHLTAGEKQSILGSETSWARQRVRECNRKSRAIGASDPGVGDDWAEQATAAKSVKSGIDFISCWL